MRSLSKSFVLMCRLATGGFVVGGLVQTVAAQTAVSVSGATSQFQTWKLSNGSAILDPQVDQQTGLKSGDFMGLTAGATGYSTTPTSAVASSMVTAGTINGENYLVFRYRMTDYNGTKSYVGSAVSVGIGFKGLGAVGSTTIYATVDSNTSGQNFFFQGGGTGLNDGPSTTSLDDGAFANNPYSKAAPKLLTSGVDWSYQKVTALGETNYDRTGTSGTDENSYVTFAIKFSDLQAATRALTGNATFTLDYSTEMAFVGWTSTQTQAINQDVNGVLNIPTTSTWTSMGAFTEYVDATGNKKPVPEASTVFQVGALLAVGVVGGIYRRRRTTSSARPDGAAAA